MYFSIHKFSNAWDSFQQKQCKWNNALSILNFLKIYCHDTTVRNTTLEEEVL